MEEQPQIFFVPTFQYVVATPKQLITLLRRNRGGKSLKTEWTLPK
jgi:hypothetical protein